MNIPRFWARERLNEADRHGRRQIVTALGWSFNTLEEARADAKARAKRMFERIAEYRNADRYDYLDRPIREEIIEAPDVPEGQAVLITRNRYGALVLNTSGAFFVDVDNPKPRPGGLLEALLWPFSKQTREKKRLLVRERIISRVRDWSAKNPARRFRLYRTHAGLRLLFVDKTYDPESQEVAAILDELNADPMYKRLTEKQQCFRARLTPKPWRCGLDRPPSRFPRDSDPEEQRHRQWESNYAKVAAEYKTCILLDEFNSTANDPTGQQVIRLHDHWSCNPADLPLA
jgi:hypothetical protein